MSQGKKNIFAVFFLLINIVCAYSLYDAAYGEYADQSVVEEIIGFEKICVVNGVFLIDVFLLIVLIVWKFLPSKHLISYSKRIFFGGLWLKLGLISLLYIAVVFAIVVF